MIARRSDHQAHPRGGHCTRRDGGAWAKPTGRIHATSSPGRRPAAADPGPDRPAARGARLHDRADRRRRGARRRSRRLARRPLPAAAPGRGGLAGRRAPPPPAPARDRRSHVAAGPTPARLRRCPRAPGSPTRSRSVLAALRRLHAAGRARTPAASGEPDERGPERPRDLETAIEAPYRLIVSPSARGAFRHSSAARSVRTNRSELWRTHLTVRTDDGRSTTTTPTSASSAPCGPATASCRRRGFDQPLIPFDRDARSSTRPTAATRRNADDAAARSAALQPVQPRRLVRLEAVVGVPGEHRRLPAPGVHGPRRLRARRLPRVPVPVRPPLLPGQDHRARGQAPRHAGRLPLAALVHHRPPADAHLPGDDRDNPFGQVTVSPLVTPDIDKPPEDQQPFVPTRNGVPFPFTLTTVDRGGETRTWPAPLVFVQAGKDGHADVRVPRPRTPRRAYFPVRQIQGRGQTLAVAQAGQGRGHVGRGQRT